jgi:hypothetical protein
LEFGFEPLDNNSAAMYGTATRTYTEDSKKAQKATSKGRLMPHTSPIMPPANTYFSMTNETK